MNFSPQSTAERQAESRAKQTTAFNAALARSEVKLMMSPIPKSEAHPEALETVLRSVFEAGANHGASEITGVMLDAMFKPKGGDIDRRSL